MFAATVAPSESRCLTTAKLVALPSGAVMSMILCAETVALVPLPLTVRKNITLLSSAVNLCSP